MPKKTQGVQDLVSEVLDTISKPYGENIIYEVFSAIEEPSPWKKRYELLSDELTSDVVNNWIGRYTKQLTCMETISPVKTKHIKIITSYSKLRH